MPLISANGTVFLIQSPLLMNNQVLTFSSKEKQVAYFSSLPKLTLQDTSFVDGEDGTYISVRGNVDEIRKYNYIMYRNENYGLRWFYGFITKMTYGGVNTTKVYLKQDVFQTWQFDLKYKPCFVEREHANTDEVGDNTVLENLDTGDYMCMDTEMLVDFTQTCLLLMIPNQSQSEAMYYNGVFSGLQFDYYENTGTGRVLLHQALSHKYAEIADKIVGILVYPTKYLIGSYTNGETLGSSETAFQGTHVINRNEILDGYIPKNKKLLCYPYNYFELNNGNGIKNIYNYEYFSTGDCTFRTTATIGQNPSLAAIPMSYKRSTILYDEMLAFNDFPHCSWATNDFDLWTAQNKNTQAISMLTTFLGGTVSMSTGNAMGAVSGVEQMASAIGGFVDRRNRGNSISGSSDNNLSYVNKMSGIKASKYCIDNNHARMIDQFFTRYGYKTCKVKIPNITGRKNWNYVKAIDSCITCDVCPTTDLEEINNMFNQGITLWHGDKSNSNVFNYSLDNGII